MLNKLNDALESVLDKLHLMETVSESDEFEQLLAAPSECKLSLKGFGSTLFFSDAATHAITEEDVVSFTKRDKDAIYPFEVSIEVPPVKYIKKRAASAKYCRFIDVDIPRPKNSMQRNRLFSKCSSPKDERYHTKLPVDPAYISNFDYCLPVSSLEGIDVTTEDDYMISADYVTDVLMKIFIGRKVCHGTTKIECDNPQLVDPIYGLEPYLNKKMSGKTLRKVVLNRFIHIIANIFESDIIRIADHDISELWCVALSEKGAKNIAHRLGYYLKLSDHACTATGKFTNVRTDERPQAAYDLRHERYLSETSQIKYLWQRYNRLGEPVDILDYADLKSHELSIFTPVHRLQLLDLALCDYLDLQEFSDTVAYGDMPFALHQPVLQERLRLESASFKNTWFPSISLDHIRSYFGEEIALYFAFLSHYTFSLMIPTVFGISMAILQMIADPDLSFRSKHVAIVRAGYAMLVALWVNFMVHSWKKKHRRLEIKWGLNRGQKEFRANRMTNMKYKYEYWVADDRYPTRYTKSYSEKKKQMRRVFSRCIGFVLIIVVVVLTNPDLHELFFKYYGILDDLTEYFQSLPVLGWIGFEFDSTVTSITILLLHKVFAWLSVSLTDLENHKYLSTYNRSIIKKFASFSGLDYLGPFLYLAFLKRHFREVYGDDPEVRYLFMLMEQLRNLFIVGMFSNVFELGMPFIKRYTSDKILEMKRMKKEKDGASPTIRAAIDPAIMERRLPAYESTLDDYIEIVTQFALVGSFAVAWTPVALLALFSNLLELRVDLIKLVSFYRRPRPVPSVSIEAWNSVLSAIASLSIVFCNLMVAFVLVPQYQIVVRLFYVFVATIICFAIKYSLLSNIQKDPESQRLLRKRNAILQDVMSHF